VKPPQILSLFYHLLKVVSGNFWHEASNRREFFLRIAASQKLDPLIPESWYSLRSTSILMESVCLRMIVIFIIFYLLLLLLLLRYLFRIGGQQHIANAQWQFCEFFATTFS
jgi:hypothetical protein